MATTTPNFGWSVPTSTDLVKDGATAIETLGDAIDASLLDLKGGTTGQVLSKNSNTDMDFTWVAQDDSNAIQNAIVDAKGDLIAATADNTPARLAVGTNGQILTADSTAATGLKWAAAGASFVGCRAYATTDQSMSNGANTVFNLDAENYDTDGFHSTTTNNSRITIPTGKAGYYLITGLATYQQGGTSGQRDFWLWKNGTTSMASVVDAKTANFLGMSVTDVQYLAVGDYVQIAGYQDSGTTTSTFAQGIARMFLAVQYLGA
jgi:hypothetical protein